MIVTAGADGAIVWDSETGEMLFRIQREEDRSDMLDNAIFGPDGHLVITQEYFDFHVWEVLNN